MGLFITAFQLAASVCTAETYQLDARIYVFKSTKLTETNLPATEEKSAGDMVVFRSPSTIPFGAETLSLRGSSFYWREGSDPPTGFTLLPMPHVVTALGKRVEILAAAPVQYLEKKSDGTLQTVKVEKNSPDAPHCRISFVLEKSTGTTASLVVDCAFDLATIAARDPVPGLELEVGRPVMAHFHDEAKVTTALGQWVALLLRAPNGNDHGLVLLVRTDMEKPAGESAPTGPLRTRLDIARFATEYYKHPQPDLIAPAIQALAPTQFLDPGDISNWVNHQNAYTCVGFFAQVFAANPDRVAAWQKLIDQQPGDTRFWLHKALKLQQSHAQLALNEKRVNQLTELEKDYVFWGAFIASGDAAYLQKLINQLELMDDADSRLFDGGGEAMALMAYNLNEHPLLRETLTTAREQAKGHSREWIDDLLHKDLLAVLQEVSDLDHDNEYSDDTGGAAFLPWQLRTRPRSDPFRMLVK